MFDLYCGESCGSPSPCSKCEIGNNGKFMFCRIWKKTKGEPAKCTYQYLETCHEMFTFEPQRTTPVKKQAPCISCENVRLCEIKPKNKCRKLYKEDLREMWLKWVKTDWERKFNQKVKDDIIATVERLRQEELTRQSETRQGEIMTQDEVDFLLGWDIGTLKDFLERRFPS